MKKITQKLKSSKGNAQNLPKKLPEGSCTREGKMITFQGHLVGLVAPGIDDGPLGPFHAAGGKRIEYLNGSGDYPEVTLLTFKTQTRAKTFETLFRPVGLAAQQGCAYNAGHVHLRRSPEDGHTLFVFDFLMIMPRAAFGDVE